MDLDKLTNLQKASINYHTSELSLIKREIFLINERRYKLCR